MSAPDEEPLINVSDFDRVRNAWMKSNREIKTAFYDRKQVIAEQPNTSLLRLPAELRNKIFEYVFTNRGDLHFTPGIEYTDLRDASYKKSFFQSTPSVPNKYNLYQEFNQLKYVCRQLYHETSCMELGLNTLCFCGTYKADHSLMRVPGEIFVRFLGSCKATPHLRHIKLGLESIGGYNVHNLLIERPDTFETIAQYCRMNLGMQVDYYFRSFGSLVTMGRQNHNSLSRIHDDMCLFIEDHIAEGIFLSQALRHKDLSHLLVDTGYLPTNALDYAQHWVGQETVQLFDTPNFKVRPNVHEVDKGSQMRIENMYRESAVEADAVIDMVEGWIKNGI